MYSYIKGIVVELGRNYIVLENNGIGYLIYVSNPYEFTKGIKTTIYLYQQVKEDDLVLFGFKEIEQKEIFLKLITVKGIGCKSAIGILATGDVNSIMNAIEASNEAYLRKIPGIGPKAAKQIILDLQGKFKGVNSINPVNNLALDEAGEVLLALGYKQGEIDKVLKLLKNEELDTNGYVKKALSLMVK